MSRSTYKRALLGAALAAAIVILAPAALASWSSAITAGSLPVSSATIAAPTGTAATETACTAGTPSALRVTVTWTATSSTRATGYLISRGTAPAGPFTTVGTVTGLNTTSWIDSTGQLQFLTTYYYVVQATVQSWTSPNSSTATVTTLKTNCK
jgi:hypothetical protein